jgi:hypothetical protein
MPAMSQLSEALSSLSEIHSHLAKSEVYQAITAKPVALSGCAGCIGAVLQVRFVARGEPATFIWYWLIVAFICGLLGSSGALFAYFYEGEPLLRRRTRIVAGQFIPCVLVGILVPLAVLPFAAQCVGVLPGLWSVFYGLGLFSTRPYLPRATGWVGLYYLTIGVLLVNLLSPTAIPSGWTLGLSFLIGQLGLALVLYRNQKRERADVQ